MIVDSHVYCLPPRLRDVAAILPVTDQKVAQAIHSHPEAKAALAQASPGGILSSMADASVDRSVLVAFPWGSAELCTETNDFLLDLCAKEGKFSCLVSVQPKTKSWQKEAENALAGGALGLKINPDWQGFALDSPQAQEVANFATEKKTVLMVHTDQAYKSSPASPAAVFEFIRAHPDCKIIASHLGGLLGLYSLHPPLKSVYQNVWFDTAVSSTLMMVRFYFEAGLGDQVIFGSDFPFNHSHSQKQLIMDIRKLGLGAIQEAKILSKNIWRLFPDLNSGNEKTS